MSRYRVLSLILTLRVKRLLALQAFKPNRQQESDEAWPQMNRIVSVSFCKHWIQPIRAGFGLWNGNTMRKKHRWRICQSFKPNILYESNKAWPQTLEKAGHKPEPETVGVKLVVMARYGTRFVVLKPPIFE